MLSVHIVIMITTYSTQNRVSIRQLAGRPRAGPEAPLEVFAQVNGEEKISARARVRKQFAFAIAGGGSLGEGRGGELRGEPATGMQGIAKAHFNEP